MADLDSIDVCLKCLTPVEGSWVCPTCGSKLKRMASLAFETVRILRGKGWNPISCKLSGYSGKKGVVVVFDGYSPGRGVHGEMRCQLDKENRPVCSTWRERSGVSAYREAYEWADEASTLRRNLPFNRMLCQQCAPQHDSVWFHGTVECPCAGLLGSSKPGATGPHEFERGFPEKCVYLAEQVMTRPEVAQSLGVRLDE